MNGRAAKKVRKEARRLAKGVMGQKLHDYRSENLELKKANKVLIEENEKLKGNKEDGDNSEVS